VAATALITARFPQPNSLYRAFSFNSLQFRDGSGHGTDLLTLWLEAEEQERRKISPAM
jgi:hypothetical protein